MADQTLTDAIDAIHTAVALGEHFDCPSGLTVYVLHLMDRKGIASFIGAYTTKDAAANGALAFATNMWNRVGRPLDTGPWSGEPGFPHGSDPETQAEYVRQRIAAQDPIVAAEMILAHGLVRFEVTATETLPITVAEPINPPPVLS